MWRKEKERGGGYKNFARIIKFLSIIRTNLQSTLYILDLYTLYYIL